MSALLLDHLSQPPTPSNTSLCVFESNAERNAVWATTLVAGIFSCFGSSFMLLSYFSFGKPNRTSSLIACLAFGDYLWSVSVIVTFTVLLAGADFPLHMCYATRGIFQIGASSTLWWASCMAIYLYYSLVIREESVEITTKMWICFHSLSWGVPCILYFIPLSLGKVAPSTLHICFPDPTWRFYAWFLPNILLFAFTTLFYAVMYFQLQKSIVFLSITQRYGLWRRLSFYLLVIFICWILDFLSFIVYGECVPAWFSICYSFLLQLQGFFDAIVYGFSNNEIVEKYRGNHGRTVAAVLLSPFILWPIVFPIFLYRRAYEWYTGEPAFSPLDHSDASFNISTNSTFSS